MKDLTSDHDIVTLDGITKATRFYDVGTRRVFDLEVEGYHNYIANGLVVHNCTSAGAQKLFQKAKPRSIVDIATLTSIYRPGPLAANVDKLYLKARNSGEDYQWPDKRITELLKETHGTIIFQEQIMMLAEKCAGFPPEECDEVRRAIMKRSISGGEEAKKKAEETRTSFVEGCIKNNYTREVADDLYDKILFFAGYGFGKSIKEDELINQVDKNGHFIKSKMIKHFKPGDYILSRNENTGEIIPTQVLNLHDHGVLRLYEVTLTSGEKFTCTLDHKFRTSDTGEMLPLWYIKELNLNIVVDDAVKDLELQSGMNIT